MLVDRRTQQRFLLSILLAPLICLISLSMPLTYFPPVYCYAILGVLLSVAVFFIGTQVRARCGGKWVITLTVEGHSPVHPVQAANTLAEIPITQNENLYTGGGRSPQEILAEQLDQVEVELTQARGEYDSLVEQDPGDSERIASAGQSIALKEEIYTRLLEQYEQTRIREALRANSICRLNHRQI